jgi:hypothetical protein
MVTRVVIGILLLAASYLAWGELEPLVRYRPVSAAVLSASLEHRTMQVARTRRGRSGTRTHSGYVPDVSYRYVVDGVPYVGSQYNRVPTLESSRAVKQRLRGIVPGTTVTAWYDPSNPSASVLSRAPNPILLAILSVAMLFCGIFWMVARPRRRAA